MPESTNGFNEYKKLILSELEKLNGKMDDFLEDQQKMKVEIAVLKIKSGIWGAIGASIPIAIGIAFKVFG